MFNNEKKQLMKTALKLYNNNLIVGTWGNLSVKVKDDEGNNFYIVTPSGIEYDEITLDDLVVLDEEKNVVEGNKKPTSELKIHMKVYEEREGINAIIHTHSTFATAFAVTKVGIPMIVEDMVQHLGGDIRVAKYALPGTEKLAENVLIALKNRNGALMKNHGAIGIGKTLKGAYNSAIIIEKTSRIYLYSKIIGHISLLSEEDAEKMIEFYNNNYGQ